MTAKKKWRKGDRVKHRLTGEQGEIIAAWMPSKILKEWHVHVMPESGEGEEIGLQELISERWKLLVGPKPGDTNEVITFRCPPEMVKALKARAKKDKTTTTECILNAISWWLKD